MSTIEQVHDWTPAAPTTAPLRRARVAAPHVETEGVAYIPEADRDSRPANVAAVFLGGNLAFSVIVFGWLPITFGLGGWSAITSTLVGLALGTAVTVPLALLGPRTGTNNAVSSGAAFGVNGRLIGSLLTLAFALAFAAISVWTGGDALVASAARVLGTPDGDVALGAGYLLIAAGIVAFALFGHGAVVWLQKAIVPVVGIAMLAGVVAFAPGFDAHYSGGQYLLGSFGATWMLSAVVAASGPISYAPSLGDYTRRISHKRYSDRRVVGAATIGVFGGLLITALFGMFTAVTFTNPSDSYVLDLVRGAPAWFVLPILVIGLAGSVGQGAMNLYATGLDMESLIPKLTRTQTTLLTSLVAITLVFLGTFVLDAVDSITALTLVLNVLAGPWVAVILVGYVKSRGSYDPHDLQVFNEGRTGGRYWYTGGWNPRATAAWVAGSTVGLLTVSTTLFSGPLAGIAGGVDISLVSSTLVAAAVYALAERS